MPDSDERDVEGIYVSHWEVARLVVPAGRRLFGLLPRVEKWLVHFPSTVPPEFISSRTQTRYFRVRLRGHLGPHGHFGHMGICSRELFVSEIKSFEETKSPGPTW